MNRTAHFASLFVVLAAGCASHHDRETPSPCRPADCYAVTESGCLDMDDTYLPETCTTSCVPGYAQLDGTNAFCEDAPSPTCSAAVAMYGLESGFFSDIDGEVFAIRRDDHSPRAEVVLRLPDDGEVVFVAPSDHLVDVFEGEPVSITVEHVAGYSVHRLTTVSGAEVVAVRTQSSPPPDGWMIGDVSVSLGGASCRAPATPAECGLDTIYRLNVARGGMAPAPVEPGASTTLGSPIPEEGTILFTHGGAVEYGADGCEVFAPYLISFVVTSRPTPLIPG